jgi:RNA polymerase subunit RPABC4/transcription elongation factor Spt4
LIEDESNLCVVCQSAARNATFVHQGTGHTVCCLACANLIHNTKHNCPVCRRKIDVVIQNFFN